MSRRTRSALIGAIALLAVVLVVMIRGRKDGSRFATAVVDRGNVVQTVGATGALQAVVTVQVGSQVSGIIQQLGADFNSVVKKGQVIARLDPSTFAARMAQARANLVAAEANVERARAAIEDARQKYERAKQLAAEYLVAATDLDTAKATYGGAVAQLAADRAAVSQNRAALTQAAVDLEHTVITAPIDGVVINRSVDVGQTVAASLQAPVLFVIANDLSQMQVNASVDESDVGKLQTGQEVTFHVDAYPERTFGGRVTQVRLQPTTNQNVVSYNTIITVGNTDLKLMPGMTASVSIVVTRREDVLRIPSAALRFRPAGWSPSAAVSRTGAPGQAGRRGEGQSGAPRGGDRLQRNANDVGASAPADAGQRATVFVLGPRGPQAVRIVTGASDGQYVEVKDGLAEGAAVITGTDGATGPAARPTGASVASPFTPQFQRRQR